MAKKSLLLVDADSKSLRMLEVSLRKSGFSVTTAVHAADARDKLKHAAPDLVITDTKLPGDESGFDFVGKLKSKPETANIPIIFLSSENRLEQKVAGLELGVEDYLTKPIYIKEVLTRVRVLLDKREKQTLERRERSSSFAGQLGDMGLVDLMQTVEIGRKTGRLFIEARGQRGQVSFREGKVCDARSGRLNGERAFYRMLVWNEGTFSMDFSPHDDADVIELSTQGLLMEGMRRVDEWGRLIEQLPPLDHRFEIDFAELVDRLAEIPDEINALLRHFDGKRTLIEVVDETDFGDLEALEIASKLYFEGLIFDVADREPSPDTAAHREAWLQEPMPTTGSGIVDDDDDGGLLVPNDTMPPMPASQAAAAHAARPVATPASLPAGSTGFLAPPTGANDVVAPLPSVVPTTLPDDAATIPVAPSLASMVPSPTTTTTTVSPSKDPSRPLPSPSDMRLEDRSVLPRSAVGARAWSTKDAGNEFEVDDDAEGTPDTINGGKRSAVDTEPPKIGASGSDEGDPLESSLARDLGLSRDELKLAIAAGTSVPPQIVPLAKPLLADDSLGDRDLARSIAAQLGDDSKADGAVTPDRPIDRDDEATLTEYLRQPPSPTPHTATPSLVKPARSGTVDTGPVAVPPSTAVATVTATDDDTTDIHTRRTRLDVEAPDTAPFGVSRPVAAAIFIAGFALVLLFVLVITRDTSADAAVPADDATALVNDAGAVDDIVVARDDVGAPPVVPGETPPGTSPTPLTADPVAVPPAVDTRDANERPEKPARPTVAPDSPEAQYAKQLKLADGLAQRGDFGRSVRAYKAALTSMPDGLAAHLGLGNAYYELDNLDDALHHLEKARALAPKDPQVYVLLGAAYQQSKRTVDAVEAYERYLALAPGGKFARDVRGILRGLKH